MLELSSFQLDGIQNFRSNIAIILNITHDHLDRYNNIFDNWCASKYRITKNQISSDYLVYNIDDPQLENLKTCQKNYLFLYCQSRKMECI